MGWVDKSVNWAISKKLFIMIIATVLVAYEKITGSEWVDVAMIYLGGQAIIDAVLKYRNRGNSGEDYFER